jgi:hypothetical protein
VRLLYGAQRLSHEESHKFVATCEWIWKVARKCIHPRKKHMQLSSMWILMTTCGTTMALSRGQAWGNTEVSSNYR